MTQTNDGGTNADATTATARPRATPGSVRRRRQLGRERLGDDVEQDQDASNSNETDQDADAEATTDQENSYEPSVDDCDRCFNGNVTQGNTADTSPRPATTTTRTRATRRTRPPAAAATRAGSGDDVDQSQDASNANETDQDADANATTNQSNTYAPVVYYCNRCFNGDVTQATRPPRRPTPRTATRPRREHPGPVGRRRRHRCSRHDGCGSGRVPHAGLLRHRSEQAGGDEQEGQERARRPSPRRTRRPRRPSGSRRSKKCQGKS